MASDLEKLDAKNKTIGSTEGGFKFLFVGRGFRKKGLDILLEACTILNKQYPGKFKLLIAGLKKKGLDSLRLNAMGLQDCVQYLGFQKDMDAVYAQASVTILPSRVEPFGMAPIQGMQRGLVPIVSKISGVAETLHDGENALILQNHLSASELAQHMQKLMTDRESLTKLSANALKTAQKLSWDATVESTVQAYEIALSLKKSGKASVSN
jgi:glycosyltransferase involved in cell wall biosynthesis